MAAWGKMSIKAKLASGFAIIVVLLAVVGVLAVRGMQTMSGHASTVQNGITPIVLAGRSLDVGVADTNAWQNAYTSDGGKSRGSFEQRRATTARLLADASSRRPGRRTARSSRASAPTGGRTSRSTTKPGRRCSARTPRPRPRSRCGTA